MNWRPSEQPEDSDDIGCLPYILGIIGLLVFVFYLLKKGAALWE